MSNFRTATKALLAVVAVGCFLTVASGSASAFDKNSGSAAQREICTSDAMNYCFSLSVDNIVACLKTDPRVSKACKAVVNGAHRGHLHPGVRVR